LKEAESFSSKVRSLLLGGGHRENTFKELRTLKEAESFFLSSKVRSLLLGGGHQGNTFKELRTLKEGVH